MELEYMITVCARKGDLKRFLHGRLENERMLLSGIVKQHPEKKAVVDSHLEKLKHSAEAPENADCYPFYFHHPKYHLTAEKGCVRIDVYCDTAKNQGAGPGYLIKCWEDINKLIHDLAQHGFDFSREKTPVEMPKEFFEIYCSNDQP